MKLQYKVPEQLNKKQAFVWLASWFGAGFINPAPGTWGSLAALPFGIAIFAFSGAYGLMISVFIITLIGLWSADKFDKAMDGHDSKMIVIDEVAGQWIALIPAALNPILILLSFVLFRFFDILKPWPISFFDKKVPGAVGVMGDDILAGLFAAICVLGISYII
ncbi:MAG: phosphatidylglycerophosphatase A family protein [Alphaproteobacteria bacterium]